MMAVMSVTLCVAAVSREDHQQMIENLKLMQVPFSQMDRMALGRIERTVDDFVGHPDYKEYKDLVKLVAENYDLYIKCTTALNSPFDFQNIVKVRRQLIAKLDSDSTFTAPQRTEMDLIDIYLSRYKRAVENFQDIITQINDDPTVISFREASRKGRTTEQQRREYVKAISGYVYVGDTKNYDTDISEYIMLIPYLKDRFVNYLNAIASNPKAKSPIETEIMAIRTD